MTRPTLTHNIALSDRTFFGDPINPRRSLNLTRYWRARERHRNAIGRPGQRRTPLWERNGDRVFRAVPINDQRTVTSGLYRRWDTDCGRDLLTTLHPAVTP